MEIRSRAARAHAGVAAALQRRPWLHWLVVFAVLLPFFTALRGVALAPMLRIFATRDENSAATRAQAVVLGLVEDAVVVTLLLVLLSACDFVLGPRRTPALLVDETDKSAIVLPESSRIRDDESQVQTPSTPPTTPTTEDDDEPIVPLHVRRQVLIGVRRLLRLAAHCVLTALALVPFAVDNVLLRTRGMRFTFAFMNMFVRELNGAAGVDVTRHEVRVSTQTSCVTLAVVALQVAISMAWLDLSQWHLARRFCTPSRAARPPAAEPSAASFAELSKDDVSSDVEYVSLEDGDHHTSTNDTTASRAPPAHATTDGYVLAADTYSSIQHTSPSVLPLPPLRSKRTRSKHAAKVVAVPVVLLAVVCSILLLVTHHIAPVVSATALNGSLNELFRVVFRTQFIQSLGDGKIDSAETYIHSATESYELFQSDVLFRKTTGFKGPLAFDVKVNVSDPPNVLVVVVESFRYQDSLYIVGNRSAALLKKQHNITLTPQFDRWAKRGVAMRNLWSSWQTSRSVESILFGQVPLDDILASGTTTGRPHVELHGMPQLFKQKGYETSFTSGVRLKFDQWNAFMPAHGFDYVLGSTAFKAYGEKDDGVTPQDWKSTKQGGEGRAGYWGVHDDITFEVLGDLMLNKTVEQQSRLRLGDARQPFFINHYTVSSHTPFLEYPKWFDEQELPDFSALAEGNEAHADEIARYAKLRYFEDLALGKFLDRMQEAGVLNDTIVVIVGDHGQSPEKGFERPDVDEVATTRVAAALIAEGRLGDSVGLVLDDAAEQYDLLNTVADIVGVPDGGFLQSGVGRSLKRAAAFGERPVWTNNPLRQLAVVKGHQRLSFDRMFDMIELYDADADPHETQDLLPTASASERRAWETLREQGRTLSRYFRVRWNNKCISNAKC